MYWRWQAVFISTNQCCGKRPSGNNHSAWQRYLFYFITHSHVIFRSSYLRHEVWVIYGNLKATNNFESYQNKRDRNSYSYQHLQPSQACHCLANRNCFSILDCTPNKQQLMLKEAMDIKWESNTLNRQLKHADLTVSFWYYFLCIYIYKHH